jgi:hypothetical protein
VSMSPTQMRPRTRPRTVILASLMLAAALLATTLVGPTLAGGQGGGGGGGGGEGGGGGGDPGGNTQIGKTKETPDPSCPKDPCQAIGSVTGFQVNAGKEEKNLFAAPEDGEIVAWRVDLSRPKQSQQKFFGKFYKEEELGTVPAARIAVLKPAEQKAAPSYTLQAQGPVVDLTEDLGTKPKYTLQEPLPISKGEIVALTVPTWIPNFAVDLSHKNVWRASRERGACENADDIKDGEPHQHAGSERVYGCTYREARILYWAYFVPS